MGRSRTACRSQATHCGINFAHKINHRSARVSLPADLALRLKICAEQQGDITVQKLARDILSSVLAQRGRARVVADALAAGAKAAARAAKVEPVPPVPPPAPSPPVLFIFAPQLYGRA